MADEEPKGEAKSDAASAPDSKHTLLRDSGDYFRKFTSTTAGSGLGNTARILLTLIAAILGAVALLWIVDKIVFFYLARSYVAEITDAFDLDPHLANALILLTFMAVVFFGRYLWSFSKQKRMIGIGGIAMLLIGHSLALWYATRNDILGTKCYVLSRDGKVTYREHPGIDPATGRECRPVTPDLVERLRDYEAGRRPKLITSNPVFFDPVSGEPIVWYHRSKNNLLDAFDLMGFDPNTGAELLPITVDVAEEWTAQHTPPKRIDPTNYIFFDTRTGEPRAWYFRDADGNLIFYDRPGFDPQTGEPLAPATREIVAAWKRDFACHENLPQQIDPNNYSFFDPTTGKARVWFWKGPDGAFEFYNACGFHPRTGDKLQIVTQDVLTKWKQDVEQQKQKSEQQKQKEEEERQRREQKTQIELQAPDRCDQLAANPNDRAKPSDVSGVGYKLLQAQSADAIAACEIAATKYPDQLRFQYQLARSLETLSDTANRQRAFAIYKHLVAAQYSAAFDNLGWLYLTLYPAEVGYQNAVPLFRAGVRLGDSDAMLSLAEMVKRGKYTPSQDSETFDALIRQAAQLGNQGAIDELANLQPTPDTQSPPDGPPNVRIPFPNLPGGIRLPGGIVVNGGQTPGLAPTAPTWNGCPPHFTLQGGACRPYQGR